MNRARTTRNGLLVALALAPAVAAGAGVVKPRVAVMAVSGGVSASSAAAARSAAEAARRAGVDAVSPDDVTRAVRATKADTACATEAACAVATCAAVGADYVLAAYVAEAESGWRIELRLRDGKRGSLRGQGAETVAREERLARESAERLAQRLVGSLLFSAGELPPPSLAPRLAAPLPPAGQGATVGVAAATATASASANPTPTSRGASTAALEAASRGAPMPVRSTRRTVGNVVLGTGAALLAGAATTGALAWSASNDASASLARGDLGGFGSARHSSRTLAWAGAALGGAGAVALAAGAWLRLGGGSSRVAVGLDPGAAGVRVAVAF
jgi:hypothetical protein